MGLVAGALSSLVSIETDYILRIAESATSTTTPTNSTSTDVVASTAANRKSVQFDKDCKYGGGVPGAVLKMEAYYCSKRYVDLRNLASALHGHAEDIVIYYAASTKDKSKNKDNKGIVSAATTSLYGTLEKWAFQGPIEAVQFLTNTESNALRTSDVLHEGAPLYVRHVLLGVDRFYEAIFSEKRQYSKKTNLDYVTKVAERRRDIIDKAFRELMQALSCAELGHEHHHPSKSENSISLPVPLLDRLIRTLEKFLLTDVLLDGAEGGSAVRKADLPQDEPNNSPIVRPMSTTRRASTVDRTEEMRILCQVVATSDLVLSSESQGDDDDTETKANTGVDAANRTKLSAGDVAREWGVLPDHPTDFAILVGVGSLFFKVLECRVVSVPLDIALAFGIVCCLVGYQMAQRSMSAGHLLRLQKGNIDGDFTSASDVYDARQHHSLPSSADETMSSTEQFSLPRLRSTVLTPNTASTSDSISVMTQNNPKSLRLLRKSISDVQAFLLGDEDKSIMVPATKTFPQFPHGAAIGSHLNCWSSPPSDNFHVRGLTYLKDKEKVPSDQYLLPCRGCDLFLTDTAPTNVGRNRSILGGKLRDVPTFIINYRLPWGVFLSYHEIPNRFLPFLRRGQGYGDLTAPLPSTKYMSGGERAFCNFLLSSTEEKNQLFKIIPMVVEGPWVVKRVVGGKPAIIGKKLPITYVYQPPEEQPHGFLAEYLEADLDIVSSAAARNILAVVRSNTQVLTIDLGYVVQGNTEEELPEQMMVGLRLHGLDPLSAELLPVLENGTTMLELDNEE